MHGDRRPYPVALITLDPEEIVHFAREHGLAEDIAVARRRSRKVIELIQGELDRVNERYAQVEKIKKFALLDHDLSQETGELTPTLKVKRNVVNEKYAGPARRALRELTPRSRGCVSPPRTGAAARRSSARGCGARRASSPSRPRSARTTLRTRVAEISIPWRLATSRRSS